MRMIALVVALMIGFVFSHSAKASDDFKSETWVLGERAGWLSLNKGEEFKVFITDSVSDGCWTNASAAQTAVELELKRSGFKVVDEASFLSNVLILNSVGYKLGDNSCAASYRLEVLNGITDAYYINGHRLKGYTRATLWEHGGILSGAKNSMNNRLKNSFVELVQKFLVQIDKNKEKVLKAAKENAEADGGAKTFWTNYRFE